MARFLAWMVRRNATTFLVSGEFSSGKMTLLNALTGCVLLTTMLAVVETFREFQIKHPYAVRTVVPMPPKESFPTLEEVVNTLYTRMRPDLFVFGEGVGQEAVDLLSAMNLGKQVMPTVHANSAYDTLLRLEMPALSSGLLLPAVRERIGRGADLVVHLRKRGTRPYLVVDTGRRLYPISRFGTSVLYLARAKTIRVVSNGLAGMVGRNGVPTNGRIANPSYNRNERYCRSEWHSDQWTDCQSVLQLK